MVRALLVVDVQPTFCEGGELPVSGGNAVAERIADYVREHRGDYGLVVTTQDWHREPGRHFSASPDFVDTWPPHGLAGTANAALHPALHGLTFDNSLRKGEFSAAYSAFEAVDEDNRPMAEVLATAGIDGIDVIGIATDHCVRMTALDGRQLGLDVRVPLPLTAGVAPDTTDRAVAAMRAAGVDVLDAAP